MRENMFEFRAGRKRVVKTVETVDEANKLMRAMIAIRNNDSLWENINVKTGHLRAVDEGFDFLGIEKEEEYFKIAKNRIDSQSPLMKFL